MYTIWQYFKPFIRKLFSSEEGLALAKERLLLIIGIFVSKPISYRHQLPTLLSYLKLTGNGVEVGVRDGTYSEIILMYSDIGKLISIDPWKEYGTGEYDDTSNVSQNEQDTLFERTTTKLLKFKNRSSILRTTSKKAAGQIPDNTLDFVYIDANHSYSACREDIELWWPKLKDKGVFAGHDYLNLHIQQGDFGVKRAVDEFVRKEKQILYVTPEKWPTWYCIKNGVVPRTRFFPYLWSTVIAQYKDKELWRKTRGIKYV